MLNLKVAFKKAIAKIAFKKAIAKISFGKFVLWRFFYDSTTTDDQATKATGKSFTESPEVTDAQAKASSKTFSEALSITDFVDILLNQFKVFSDVLEASDNQTLNIRKKPNDVVAFTEAQAKDFAKVINETFYATDDLDGEASADDEQNITFVKVRSEILPVTDAVSILFNQGRIFADSSATSDSGSLRSQGYVSFDYFSEDYVGESRTF
jgi:hypothetical protein